MRRIVAVWMVLLGTCAFAAGKPDVVAETERFRDEREQKLRAPDGWLSLAGLFALKAGENTFGSGDKNAIVLPTGTAPEWAGTLLLTNERVELRLQPGVAASVRGEAVRGPRALASDATGTPDLLDLGRLQMLIIKRGDRLALRVRWPDNPTRTSFAGLRWYPVRGAYRVSARYREYARPRTVKTVNVLGDAVEFKAPGDVVFSIEGREVRLTPMLEEGDDSFFFVFKDATSRDETYPGGRFLDAPMPKDGRVILDFNRAINPPCAYTQYATCPLAPSENVLAVRIPAGEKRPPGFGGHR